MAECMLYPVDKSPEDSVDRRAEEYRISLYCAIYSGDIFKAREIADMMAMIDIDRDLIEVARRG